MHTFYAIVVLSLSLLSGCASISVESTNGDRGIDGIPCAQAVVSLPQGLSESTNSTLVERAQMPSGKGGVCSAKVYSVTHPVVLYRVFDGSKPYTMYGGWWSLKPPNGTKSDYRQAYAICPEWSQLDRAVSCEVRPGSQLVIGTTQSVACADGTVFAKTAEVQVYVPNNGEAGIIHVGNCSKEVTWP